MPGYAEKNILVSALRLDKLHPVVSGNKYFKLKYHLQYALDNNYEGILTFGGAWSNHIIAAAYAASLHSLKSIGIIRGTKPPALSKTLLQAQEYGMQLEFVSKKAYKDIQSNTHAANISDQFPLYYIIPEGGGGSVGIKGAHEILELVNKNDYSHIACVIGTGATYCGIVNASAPGQAIIGIPVLKGLTDLLEQLSEFFIPPEKKVNCRFFYDYHFGGYAKHSSTLIDFMKDFYHYTSIPTDFVYTGKLFFAINDLVEKKIFPPGSHVLVIHSGGLQGNDSLREGTLNF